MSKLALTDHPQYSGVDFPVTIPLQDHEDFVATGILRLLPGKRVVLDGTFNGRPAVAKIFLHKHSEIHCQQEVMGFVALQKSGCEVPQLACATRLREDKHPVVVTEKIVGQSGADYFEKAGYAAKLGFLTEIVLLLAKQHGCGFIQKDLHLKNFLVREDEDIICLDGGDVVYERRLKMKKCLAHLSLLFAQVAPEYDAQSDRLLQTYFNARSCARSPISEKQFLTLVAKRRKKRIGRFLKKIYRNCSAYVSAKNWQRYWVCRRDHYQADLQSFLTCPNTFLQREGIECIKPGNTCSVYKCYLDGRQVIIKRYNIKSLEHALRRGISRSRASMSWRRAHEFSQLGLPTALPIALYEKRFGPIRREAYLIMECVQGMEVRQFFLREVETAKNEVVAQEVVQDIQKLFAARFSHGDMKSRNIMLVRETEGWRPTWIDLDSVRRHYFMPRTRYKQRGDIKRFMESWQHHHDVFALFDDKLETV